MKLHLLSSLLILAGCVPTASAQVAEVRIGSKKFTESVILGEMLVHLTRSAGARAEHRRELGGTQILWKALLNREIDVYPEYTGTLKQEVFRGAQDLDKALAEHGIRMSRPLGFNNTYALGMKAEVDSCECRARPRPCPGPEHRERPPA